MVEILGILGVGAGLAGLVYGSMQLKENNASVKKIVNSDMMKHHLRAGEKLWAKDLEEIASELEAKELAELEARLKKLEELKATQAEEAEVLETEATNQAEESEQK
jgi:hypothetical protein